MLLGLAWAIMGATVRYTRKRCWWMFCDSVLDEDTLFHLRYERIMVKDLLSAKGKMSRENVFLCNAWGVVLMVVAWDFSHTTGYNRHQSMMMCIARCWKLLIFVTQVGRCMRRWTKFMGLHVFRCFWHWMGTGGGAMRLTIRSRVYNDKHGQLIKGIKTKNNY